MTFSALTHARPVSVRFCNESACPLTQEEVSVAIARVAKEGKSLAIDCRRKRCSAGSTFACSNATTLEELVSIYIDGEHVFPDRRLLERFLRTVRKNPKALAFVECTPGVQNIADVIVLFVRPDAASRLLGLSAYLGRLSVDVIPAAPTCAALFRPLIVPDCLHVNFVDYFDREYQAPGLYAKEELLLSMTPMLYRALEEAFEHSAHGKHVPTGIPVY